MTSISESAGQQILEIRLNKLQRGEAYTMSEREKLKLIAEEAKSCHEHYQLTAFNETFTPEKVLALLSELEQAEGLHGIQRILTDEAITQRDEAEAALRTLRQASAWIPVSELPTHSDYVLIAWTKDVSKPADFIDVAKYDFDDEHWELERTSAQDETIYMHGEVTHWKALPKTPAALAAEGGK